ncbi:MULTISPECIES: leucyl/phenylalanyl-tRNA--protein transferase [Kytococcus]|uniref:Leucyl/phenylalanyl-tRNA--protein transferase n=1 Tax=Kytococcus schroeteri TaxID=138300 RepID=A0A2I1PAM1_9MICO|nr:MULTISPECIES: leucyl/phenylalanyl-tRNA--protein transferase [Kytococcus]OFS15183.1 leucyl/phenylalanyl-tRNA--protein transferase [Kytococcus sp. HMSC28H12]PKZ41668.1 leucyl/phenylalanyl-tRNA--protein transferase [Kytococcus schroeteri]
MRLRCRLDFAAAVASAVPGDDLVGVGGDLAPETLLSAYTHGVFPMGVGGGGSGPVGWWFPEERGVLLPGGLHVSRSLRRSMRAFTLTTDAAFDDVVAACADPRREGAWITPTVRRAYGRLHRLGHAHSVEVWQESRLVGGLYGVGIGGFFAGESMFHHVTDASKAAMVGMARVMDVVGERGLVDVQWRTDHLASMGVTTLPRAEYLRRLDAATDEDDPWRRAAPVANSDVG